MAKSRLSASRNKNQPLTEPKAKDNVTSLDLTFELLSRGRQYSTKYNLLDWCYEQCDPQNSLAHPSRLDRIRKLKTWVDSEMKNQRSHATIDVRMRALKDYLLFCDIKKNEPFSQAGYLAYAGNSGELRRLVKVATEQKKYRFEYYHGEEYGLVEASAYNKKLLLDDMLSILDVDVMAWQVTIQPFSGVKIDSYLQPYTSREWHTLVKRTQLFFFSLATKLIVFKEENPEARLPGLLDGVVIDRVDDRDITATIGNGDIQDGAGSPFNQCMAAAYVLFAYYTAFNDTVIKEIRHPIKVVTSKVEGRTSKIAQVHAYKGRASKDVKALFATSDENMHQEATETEAGFLVANINKRDSVGNVDGIRFLEKLEILSKTYSNDPFDTLIYFLDNKGNKNKVNVNASLSQLSYNLNIMTDRRGDLAEHLVKIFTEILQNNKITTFKWCKKEDGSKIMSKQVIDLNIKTKTSRLIPIAYAALSCFTDVSLRNALLPLHYSNKNENGDIKVSFKYEDGSSGDFIVAAKYQSFLRMVENYAASRNPIPSNKGSRSAIRPSFLLPLGKPSETFQWPEGSSPISLALLNACGIGYGDYFLNVSASRIRLTHSDLEYDPKDRGLVAQQILQHSMEIADKRYRNGHPVSNNRQLSQGMNTLTFIADGKTRKEAIEQVRREFKIPILEYDKWKSRNQPTNPNGIICDGEIDLVSEKDWHKSARIFAEKQNIIEKGQDITCFQYDLCVFCKSAKLVDDPYAIYKLLSFLEALGEAIDQYPERASVIQKKIERFQEHLDGVPIETVRQAENLLEERGRYPLFNSLSSVTQFL